MDRCARTEVVYGPGLTREGCGPPYQRPVRVSDLLGDDTFSCDAGGTEILEDRLRPPYHTRTMKEATDGQRPKGLCSGRRKDSGEGSKRVETQ